jgi:hypothetical protein
LLRRPRCCGGRVAAAAAHGALQGPKAQTAHASPSSCRRIGQIQRADRRIGLQAFRSRPTL